MNTKKMIAAAVISAFAGSAYAADLANTVEPSAAIAYDVTGNQAPMATGLARNTSTSNVALPNLANSVEPAAAIASGAVSTQENTGVAKSRTNGVIGTGASLNTIKSFPG